MSEDAWLELFTWMCLAVTAVGWFWFYPQLARSNGTRPLVLALMGALSFSGLGLIFAAIVAVVVTDPPEGPIAVIALFGMRVANLGIAGFVMYACWQYRGDGH